MPPIVVFGCFRHFWAGTPLGRPWDPPGTPLGPPGTPPGTPLTPLKPCNPPSSGTPWDPLGPPWDPPGPPETWDPPENPPRPLLPQTDGPFWTPPPPTPLGPPSDPPDTPSQEFARFWSKIQKTRDHPEPSISVLKNRIFNWDPGRSWGPPHLGCFWRQTFPFKGGSEFEARGGLRRLFCL